MAQNDSKVIIPVSEVVKTNSLTVDGKNPNHMSGKQRDALKENIKRFGFIVPIITNKDGLIADGQTRWEIAKEMGMEEVSIVRLPVSDVDRRILRQVLNKLKGEHDFLKDVEEYEFIFENNKFEDLSKLMGRSKEYFDDVMQAVNSLPEEYLELKELNTKDAEALKDLTKVVKFELTEKQREKLLKRLKEGGKKIFEIKDFFIMVEL